MFENVSNFYLMLHSFGITNTKKEYKNKVAFENTHSTMNEDNEVTI